MADLILHHYPASPYSEKVRIAFGYKGLGWKSVTIPVVMPKPDLMPLTGGYRKTPVMQIGADIYLDTQIILEEIERRHPAKPLLPAAQDGRAQALAWWIERATFGMAATTIFATIGDKVPDAFKEDRAKFSGREFDTAKMKAADPIARDTIDAHIAWAAAMLRSSPFLLGNEPTIADLALYHIVWFLERNLGPGAGGKVDLSGLKAWSDRIKAFGHGAVTDLDAKAALETAKTTEPDPIPRQVKEDGLGRNPGDAVVVMADDTGRDPVQGELVALDARRIVIARDDASVGRLHLHFPRAGFILRKL